MRRWGIVSDDDSGYTWISRELPGGARQRIVTPNSPLSRLSETGLPRFEQRFRGNESPIVV